MMDIIKEMEEVCPDALLLNYTNPMAIVNGAILKSSSIKAVGLCHSVQNCAENLLDHLDMKVTDLNWKIAGINHMAWLLEVKDGQKDIYPEIRQKAAVMNKEKIHDDMVRFDMMARFGFYITESSEHLSEYTPYWIKRQYPNLIERFNIPLDEYPRRCESQITEWETQREEMVNNINLVHKKTTEFGSYILEAIITGNPYRIHGNILNNGLIPNLPAEAIVEIPCLVDKNGIQGCRVDPLPQVCAALNRTNINVQLLTIEAALEGSKDSLYQAAYLDPHTAAELSLEEIRNLCDDLIESHGDFLPKLT